MVVAILSDRPALPPGWHPPLPAPAAMCHWYVIGTVCQKPWSLSFHEVRPSGDVRVVRGADDTLAQPTTRTELLTGLREKTEC